MKGIFHVGIPYFGVCLGLALLTVMAHLSLCNYPNVEIYCKPDPGGLVVAFPYVGGLDLPCVQMGRHVRLSLTIQKLGGFSGRYLWIGIQLSNTIEICI